MQRTQISIATSWASGNVGCRMKKVTFTFPSSSATCECSTWSVGRMDLLSISGKAAVSATCESTSNCARTIYIFSVLHLISADPALARQYFMIAREGAGDRHSGCCHGRMLKRRSLNQAGWHLDATHASCHRGRWPAPVLRRDTRPAMRVIFPPRKLTNDYSCSWADRDGSGR